MGWILKKIPFPLKLVPTLDFNETYFEMITFDFEIVGFFVTKCVRILHRYVRFLFKYVRLKIKFHFHTLFGALDKPYQPTGLKNKSFFKRLLSPFSAWAEQSDRGWLGDLVPLALARPGTGFSCPRRSQVEGTRGHF